MRSLAVLAVTQQAAAWALGAGVRCRGPRSARARTPSTLRRSRAGSPRRVTPRPDAPPLRPCRRDRLLLRESEDPHPRRVPDRLRGGLDGSGGAGRDAAGGELSPRRTASRPSEGADASLHARSPGGVSILGGTQAFRGTAAGRPLHPQLVSRLPYGDASDRGRPSARAHRRHRIANPNPRRGPSRSVRP